MPLMSNHRRAALATAILVAAAACGAEGGRPAADAEMPQDTFVRPIEREPLTEADLAGIDMAELAVELPWTRNTLLRDAAPGTPAGALAPAEVAGHAGFDRALFAFDDTLPPVGYRIHLADAGATVACGARTETLSAARSLVVSFTPAASRPGGPGPGALASTGAGRMTRAGVLCDEGGTLTWVAELSQADQVRVLELRSPSRIAVDVR